MSTVDELFDLSDYQLEDARALTWEIETNEEYGWDRSAFFYDGDASILQTSFSIDLTAGNEYNFRSSSFFDPYILTVADETGNALAIGPADTGTYGTTSIYDFVAPYTGKYYIDAAWNPGSYYDWGAMSVYEYGQGQSPVAADDYAKTTRDTAVTLTTADLTGNDTDPDDDTLSIASVGNASNGTAVLNPDGTVTFTPDAGFAGAAGFDYTVSDGQGGEDIARVDVTVQATNRAPSLEAIAAQTVDENSAAGTAVVTASATDPDGDALTYSLSGADAGAFAIDSVSGEITLAASPDFENPADADGDNTYELTVRATDPDGEAVDENFTVEVVDVNETDDTTEPDNPADDPQARIFLAADGDLTLSSAAVVFGRGGDGESALLDQGVRNVSLDGNVDRIDLPVNQAETTFQIVNSELEIRTGGDRLLELTGGLNQAVDLRFADGDATLAQTGAARFDLTGSSNSTLTVDSKAKTPGLGLGPNISATAGGSSPESPDGTMAKVFLYPSASFTLADPAEVLGRSGGEETIKLTKSARGVELDGNIERVELPMDLSATTFQVTDGNLRISAADGSILSFTGGLNQAVALQFGNGEGTVTQTGATSFTLTAPSGQASIGPTPSTPDIGLGGAIEVGPSDDGAVLSAATGDQTFDFANGEYGVTIEQFEAGDALNFSEADAEIFNVLADADQTDGQQEVAVANAQDGSTITITLVGLTDAEDSSVFNQASFESTFGSGSLVI